MTRMGGKGSPAWLPEEDAKVKRLADQIKPRGRAGWAKLAEQFHGRTGDACKLRHFTLLKREGKIATSTRAKPAKLRAERGSTMQAPIEPSALPQAVTITGFVFGDPPPGRSALDQRMAQR